ncbi:hypothetical protein [Frigoriflavimonas asaccharolytica]|uniref:Uncharacterized protein n=1 Tax=Frigoriflavimonas asaccharolytica TaxID=2735899 RepID=A0A8J8K9G1_9FLAO|nr:hypothetical protein [Frigoriflavimonas asaccharolytica]NRS93768.1 hypothetical protein [Frigoriflavimonas asaccharolytica]
MEEFLNVTKSFGAIILAIVASWLAYRHNKLTRELSNDNLQKQLFIEFNSRYDKLNDLLQFVINLSAEEEEQFNNAANNEKFGEFTKAFITFKINDYFNLCSEEYYWYSKRRIDERIWSSWKKGMNDIFSSSVLIQNQWHDEIKNEGWKSFYLDKPKRLFV